MLGQGFPVFLYGPDRTGWTGPPPEAGQPSGNSQPFLVLPPQGV
ncbi:MAG: hypothetical protein RMI90_08350 [Thermoguttaceae bacterium]|nr:hypothetical protein [Thermoguttaceae bacterium]